MIDALSNRATGGLEARRSAERRVAELQAVAEEQAVSPAVIKQITPREALASRAIEGSEKDYQRYVDFLRFSLESEHSMGWTNPPGLANHESLKTYAEVIVDGKVIATLDNQGVARAENSMGGALLGKLLMDVNGKGGPILAQARAEQIASMFGGEVKKADTAITQERFESIGPPPRPERIIDRDRMEADPRFAELQTIIQKRAEYLAGN